MKTTRALCSAAAVLLTALAARAADPVAVKVTVEPSKATTAIPEDFAGVSHEMQLVLADEQGKHYFSADNAALLKTFKTLGIRNLRVGGNTTDKPTVPIPSEKDIDALFAFAKAADVPVIFTLRLRAGGPEDAARVAKYVVGTYGSQVQCVAVGNEPNVYAKTYPEYRDAMKKYFPAIRDAAPGVKFCGPSPTPGKVAWTKDFVEDFGDVDYVTLITQHAYPGGSARKVEDVAKARADMLSPEWVKGYQKMHDVFVPAAKAKNKPVRIEEVNSFFNGGAKDVSDTFAASLWGLDYMHWWAAHGIAGVNFHTGDNVAAGDDLTPCRYALYRTSDAGYHVHPMGYAVKAFSLGSDGKLTPVDISAPDGLNLTAYAVTDEQRHVAVTLINKEHGPDGKPARVTLSAGKTPTAVRTITLTARSKDIAAQSGITLGGAEITDNANWTGKWTNLPGIAGDGSVTIDLPPASATVVELSLR